MYVEEIDNMIEVVKNSKGGGNQARLQVFLRF